MLLGLLQGQDPASGAMHNSYHHQDPNDQQLQMQQETWQQQLDPGQVRPAPFRPKNAWMQAFQVCIFLFSGGMLQH